MFEAALLSTLKEMNCCLMINRCENCSTDVILPPHPRSSTLILPYEFHVNLNFGIVPQLLIHLKNICIFCAEHLWCYAWNVPFRVRQYTPHLSTPAPLFKRLKNPTDFLVIRNDKFEVPRPTHSPKLPRLTPSKKLVVSLSWNCFLSSKSFFDLH